MVGRSPAAIVAVGAAAQRTSSDKQVASDVPQSLLGELGRWEVAGVQMRNSSGSWRGKGESAVEGWMVDVAFGRVVEGCGGRKVSWLLGSGVLRPAQKLPGRRHARSPASIPTSPFHTESSCNKSCVTLLMLPISMQLSNKPH